MNGEGRLGLRMSAPGTVVGSAPTDTSVVVEATIDGGVAQTVVLFGGAHGRPTYDGLDRAARDRPALADAVRPPRPLDHVGHADGAR